jgi:predicted nucleotidyltransferase
MTQAAGIIAEYNPFHNGHAWQIEQIRRRLGPVPVIAVMSGHFTQRGEPVILDKWRRAEAAVRGGVNLVLELPFRQACRSAEFFARGGVELLAATGLAGYLCFSAECTDSALLSAIAARFGQEDFAARIKSGLQKGQTYARAVETAIRFFFPQAPASVHQPNSILAVEYLKALSRHGGLSPVILPRSKGTRHLDAAITGRFASATAIRQALGRADGDRAPIWQALPAGSAQILQTALATRELLLNNARLETIALYRLRQLSAEAIGQIADVSEGLENRLKAAAFKATALGDLLAAAGRRYPRARLSRVISQLLIFDAGRGIEAAQPYIRVLAFDQTGRALLKKLRSTAGAPIITNLPAFYRQNAGQALLSGLEADIRATDLFYLLLGKNKAGEDFRQRPIYVRDD